MGYEYKYHLLIGGLGLSFHTNPRISVVLVLERQYTSEEFQKYTSTLSTQCLFSAAKYSAEG